MPQFEVFSTWKSTQWPLDLSFAYKNIKPWHLYKHEVVVSELNGNKILLKEIKYKKDDIGQLPVDINVKYFLRCIKL